MKKFLLALGAFALIACAAPANAGNTVLFSSSKGDISFPISPPSADALTPGLLDNTTIGATTPAPATFTSVKFSGTAPAPTGTGTPTIVATSTDTAGEVTAGASATSVIITFSSVKTNAPFCVVTSQTQLAAFAYTITGTAITITQTATSGNKIDYNCTQR